MLTTFASFSVVPLFLSLVSSQHVHNPYNHHSIHSIHPMHYQSFFDSNAIMNTMHYTTTQDAQYQRAARHQEYTATRPHPTYRLTHDQLPHAQQFTTNAMPSEFEINAVDEDEFHSDSAPIAIEFGYSKGQDDDPDSEIITSSDGFGAKTTRKHNRTNHLNETSKWNETSSHNNTDHKWNSTDMLYRRNFSSSTGTSYAGHRGDHMRNSSTGTTGMNSSSGMHRGNHSSSGENIFANLPKAPQSGQINIQPFNLVNAIVAVLVLANFL